MISWAVGYYIKAIGAITSILQMKRLGLGKFIYLFKGIYAVSGRDNLESGILALLTLCLIRKTLLSYLEYVKMFFYIRKFSIEIWSALFYKSNLLFLFINSINFHFFWVMKIQRYVIASIFSLARLPFIDLIYKHINFTLLFILHLLAGNKYLVN